MYGIASLSRLGRLLASPARTTILDALLDGRAHPASALATRAGVAPSTASAHLAALVDGGLIFAEPCGRQRRYRLAGPAVASALEALGGLAPAGSDVTSLRASTMRDRLVAARTCYDHLAGRLGVAVTDALLRRGDLRWRDGSLATSGKAERSFAAIGVDIEPLLGGRRPVLRACLDWTEDRPHLAGAIGAAMCSAFLEQGWVRRRDDSRALDLTALGRTSLRDRLGIEP